MCQINFIPGDTFWLSFSSGFRAKNRCISKYIILHILYISGMLALDKWFHDGMYLLSIWFIMLMKPTQLPVFIGSLSLTKPRATTSTIYLKCCDVFSLSRLWHCDNSCTKNCLVVKRTFVLSAAWHPDLYGCYKAWSMLVLAYANWTEQAAIAWQVKQIIKNMAPL